MTRTIISAGIAGLALCGFGGAQAALPALPGAPAASAAANGADDTPGIGPSGSGRKRPRIPGGSGCDDPGDILEHPECRA
jgi:hypothetical protein